MLWLERASSFEGMSEYLEEMLLEGNIGAATKLIQRHPPALENVINLMADPESVIEKCLAVPDVLGGSPFIYYKTGIQSKSTGDGIVIRGIDLERELTTGSLAENIRYGEYSFTPWNCNICEIDNYN